MKKPILILALSASFIAGTMVAGNFVFADDTDGQNSLLDQILEAILEIKDGPVFVQAVIVPQTVICPDNSQPHENYHSTTLFWHKGDNFVFAASPIEIRDQDVGMSMIVFISNGDVSETDYTLVGAVNSNSLCSGIAIPSAATLSGDCGIGTTATLTTEQGFSATLATNTVCG